MANYNKCPNGHYYDASLDACPYCASKGSQPTGGTVGYDDLQPSIAENENTRTGTIPVDEGDGMRTVQLDLETELNNGAAGNHYDDETLDINAANRPQNAGNAVLGEAEHTVFFDEEDRVVNGKQEKVVAERSRRKLVGWLVTYSSDPMGEDFRLYEGKNVIGRDPRVQITLQDSAVSNTHATIRFLRGKFAIKDEMSSHGTLVNGEDIELNAVYLNDGDLIEVGHTTLKFRSAL